MSASGPSGPLVSDCYLTTVFKNYKIPINTKFNANMHILTHGSCEKFI